MNQPPLNPDARRECVDMILEIMGYPRAELFEYPNRADDSIRYITRAERTLDKILAVAQPEVQVNSKPNQNLEFVNSVEELDALPLGTIIQDSDDECTLQALERGSIMGTEWYIPGVEKIFTSKDVELPARVLWSPEVTDA